MLTQLARTLLLAQADAGSPPGWAYALLIALIAVAAALAWMFTQLRASQRRLAQLAVEHESTTGAHRELLERERKQAKTLDEKRDDIRDLKRELAAQKKKNHTAQEETKAQRKEIRNLSEDLARTRKQPSRPAFADKPEPTEKKMEAKETPAPEKKAEPEPREQPKVADNDSADRVSRLEAESRDKGEALQRERSALRETRAELKNLRRRVEGLRRVDLVSTGKIEMLEDKLRSVGRQYYDAVSELAVLKGEVKPPPPRDQKPTTESSKHRDDLAEMADDETDAETEVATRDAGDANTDAAGDATPPASDPDPSTAEHIA